MTDYRQAFDTLLPEHEPRLNDQLIDTDMSKISFDELNRQLQQLIEELEQDDEQSFQFSAYRSKYATILDIIHLYADGVDLDYQLNLPFWSRNVPSMDTRSVDNTDVVGQFNQMIRDRDYGGNLPQNSGILQSSDVSIITERTELLDKAKQMLDMVAKLVEIREYGRVLANLKVQIKKTEDQIVDIVSRKDAMTNIKNHLTSMKNSFRLLGKLGSTNDCKVQHHIESLTDQWLDILKHISHKESTLKAYKEILTAELNQHITIKTKLYCPICLYDVNVANFMVNKACGHTMCKDCRNKVTGNCPCCRSSLDTTLIYANTS